MLKLHFKVEVPREKVNISVETKRNVIRYNGQRKYDGTTLAFTLERFDAENIAVFIIQPYLTDVLADQWCS